MAHWVPVVLEWTGKNPDKATLEALSHGLKALDGDMPNLTPDGLSEELRSPGESIDLQLIVNAFTRLGYECHAMCARLDFMREIETEGRKWIEPDSSDLIGNYYYHEFMAAYCWYWKWGPGSKTDKQA